VPWCKPVPTLNGAEDPGFCRERFLVVPVARGVKTTGSWGMGAKEILRICLPRNLEITDESPRRKRLVVQHCGRVKHRHSLHLQDASSQSPQKKSIDKKATALESVGEERRAQPDETPSIDIIEKTLRQKARCLVADQNKTSDRRGKSPDSNNVLLRAKSQTAYGPYQLGHRGKQMTSSVVRIMDRRQSLSSDRPRNTLHLYVVRNFNYRRARQRR
jgi:hypothetical protein